MIKAIREFLKEFIVTIVIAFVLSMILRTWVIEGRIVPTGSMLPTIQLKDRLLVNKLIYHFEDPQRGDIMVFRPPDKIGAKDDFVKRLIALPGDKVEIKNGQLYVNDQVQQEPYIDAAMNYEFGPVIVPPNSYFVMGDNRNASFDSHLWGAWLTHDHLIGKAFFIYWPLDHFQTLKR
ncbi:MAG: signal peptidase I [Syntrophomonas sp.]